MIDANNLEHLKDIISKQDAVLVYFSHEKCNVCKTLKPKLINHFKENFPKFKLVYADIEKHPDIAGAFSVFTVPVLTINLEGKEFIRKARSFGIGELSEAIARPYQLMFE